MSGLMWVAVTIVGAFLLAGVIFWAMLRNRKPSRHDVAVSEAGARDLRERLDREDGGNTPPAH